jgi:NAD-dependent dihydropyrimidine dehydrogenase PreA subunit
MAVHINFKICDNSADCNCIRACPTGAFYWDDKNKTIAVDKDKCVNCGKCVCCDVGAVRLSKDDKEAKDIENEYQNDTRTTSDLFVDRYGASPILPTFVTTEKMLDTVLTSKRPFVIKLYKDETVCCMLKSIPIKEILKQYNENATFRKVKVETDILQKRYGVAELPALVFIKDNNVLGHIDGYYLDANKHELFSLIKTLCNNKSN